MIIAENNNIIDENYNIIAENGKIIEEPCITNIQYIPYSITDALFHRPDKLFRQDLEVSLLVLC
jgi:hypothetical protein